MFAKKAPVAADAPSFRKELESLYARRSAIDALIRSLEDYNRCRKSRLGAQGRNGTWARHQHKAI
jgi:hypothetical protein